MLNAALIAIAAFAAGVLFDRLILPAQRRARWLVIVHEGQRMLCWSVPRPDGRTSTVRLAAGASARQLASNFNHRGVTPDDIDAAIAHREGRLA